ncbi:GDSL esterase lipase [Musa troglodytarum]|uniref:GDSL esterase lipase n=1 Tax=Musa troglodytarum TaxID=320322 RepID=A0A9E7GC53_9LILI|nr:GDSL esterase lipase [Musa troglodytarum]
MAASSSTSPVISVSFLISTCPVSIYRYSHSHHREPSAESLGLPHISAFLDSVAANFSHGANFATSLSTILPQNVTLARGGYSPFSLDVQLKQFLQLRHRSRAVYRRGGVFGHLMPKEEHFARALYMFDIGQNDLTALYFQNVSATPYLSAALKELSRVVQTVYERGGRSFWIHNTGPLGCLPYVLVRVPPAASRLDSSGCSILFNALAEQFNTMLNETVAQLRKRLPLASLILTDIYSVKDSLFRRAAIYGNADTTTFCEVNLIAELSSSHACAMAHLLAMF